MGPISVAVALQSGEPAEMMMRIIDEHPLLELCGVARTLPDLLRLLPRFKPVALLISPSLLEEAEPERLSRQERADLSRPVSFLLTGPDTSWGEEELVRVLRQPLRCAGIIAREVEDGNELYATIRQKAELFFDPGPLPAERDGGRGGTGRAPGLIAVTGAKGGVGATLISCALAALLAREERRVLLLDMDRDLSQTLHIRPGNEGKSFLDLLPLAEELSWDLVRVSVHRHAAGFHVLPFGRPPRELEGREGALPEYFLRNLLFLFDTVVMDIPRPDGKDLMRLVPHLPLVLLVSQPDALSANCARRAASRLRGAGLDRRQARLVVNRCGPRHVLAPEELAGAVGLELCAAIPEDARSGTDFAELGEIPSPDSRLGRTLAQMARELGFETGAYGGVAGTSRPRLPRLRQAGRRAWSLKGGGR